MESRPKPIGFWLKQLHDLIESQLTAELSDQRLTRRHWQVLNTLAAAPATSEELDRALAPFRGEPGPDVAHVLNGTDGLIMRGWAEHDPAGDRYALTELGCAAHAILLSQINAFRAKLMTGLTPQQYSETVQVLATMTANARAALEEALITGP